MMSAVAAARSCSLIFGSAIRGCACLPLGLVYETLKSETERRDR